MNAKELAQRLNGREYGRGRLLKGEIEGAKAAGLVVAYGESDDLLELEGAVSEEVEAWNGQTVYFTKMGLLLNECDHRDCPYFEKVKASAIPLGLVWNNDPALPSWTFNTQIPHETFDIVEDGAVFCRGIVFALADVPA